MTVKDLVASINEIVTELGIFHARMPRFRYWTRKNQKGTKYAFCWTTERDSKGKFHALKYRILKQGTWKLVKDIAFGKRRIAKARARRWRNQLGEK